MTDLQKIEAAVDALETARHCLSDATLTGASADEMDAYNYSLIMRRTALLDAISTLQKEVSVAHMVVEEARRNEVRAEAALAASQAALRKYGRHADDCVYLNDQFLYKRSKCDCGLDAALAQGVAGPLPEEPKHG